MTQGIKHLIECHCSLILYKNRKETVYHKFPVYSKLDENNNIIEKTIQCNNCGVIHKITDICKSEILGGKDELKSALSVEDISLQLDSKLSNILTINNCDISTWEHVLDIVDEERWGEHVVLGRQIVDSKQNVKLLILHENKKIRIINQTIEDEIIVGKDL